MHVKLEIMDFFGGIEVRVKQTGVCQSVAPLLEKNTLTPLIYGIFSYKMSFQIQ